MTTEKPNKLMVVWTSAEREVALEMVLMYTANAIAWWDQVNLMIWGPSQKLFLEDQEIQDAVKRMGENGVRLLACAQCAKDYGIFDELLENGVETYGMGAVLSNWLKSGSTVITF